MVKHRQNGMEWWCLPGGAQEPGETEQEGALRELREECNVVGTLIRQTSHMWYTPSDEAWTFLVDIGEQDPSLGHDPDVAKGHEVLADVQWMRLCEIPERDRAFLWAAGLLGVGPFFSEVEKWGHDSSYPGMQGITRKLLKAFLIVSVCGACVFMTSVMYEIFFHKSPYDKVPFAATCYGRVAPLEKWLSAGGDPNARSDGGWPLICIAVHSFKSNPETVDVLLRHGADPNAMAEGRSAFIWAASNSFGDIEYMNLLAAYGANIDCHGADGITPVQAMVRIDAGPEETRRAERTFERIRAIAAQYQEFRGVASQALKKP